MEKVAVGWREWRGGSRESSRERRRKRLSGRSYERVRHAGGGCARTEAR